jgi:hypothetical protein
MKLHRAFFRSTAAVNGTPYSQIATVSSTTGAAYECVKYTCVPSATPLINLDGFGITSEFQPT